MILRLLIWKKRLNKVKKIFLAITQTVGEMTINHDEPLFPSSTVWYPGLSLRNTIEVKNTGGSVRGLGINSTNTSHTGGLINVLILKVDDGGHYVFGGNDDKTMKDFWNEGDFKVANLGPYETKTIGFTISMPESLGNEYQSKEAKFDLIIGFFNQSSTTAIINAGQVKGVTTKNLSKYIFPVISLILLILLILYFYKKRRNNSS